MLFIHFSSVGGFFGGADVGAYAAANSFLDAFSHYQRYETSRRTYCFAWSTWDEIGMSRNYPLKELTRARGYCALSGLQGLYSFLVGLRHGKVHLLVGLNDGNRQIRMYTGTGSPLQKMSAYFVARSDHSGTAEFRQFVVRDRFGTATICEFVQLEAMPLTEKGEIDLARIAARGATPGRLLRETIAPRIELERRIAALWQEVFAAPQVSIHDNFFDAGGDSLMAMRLLSRLREVFNIEMSLRRLFEAPTVAELADVISDILATDITQSPS
jgi:acyl carrier protein